MPLWRFEQQYRQDTPPPARPLYYWTNCYAWQDTDPPDPDADNLTLLIQAQRYFIPQQTTQVEWRVTAPDGSYQWPLGTIENSGLAPFTGPPGLPHLCVLVEFFHTHRRVGYKRYRGPWQSSLARGSLWDSALISYFEQQAVPNIMVAPVCNHRGVLFDDFRVRPEIHQWQKRHGSKRAARPVFVMPAGG